MAYSDFTARDLRQKFGISFRAASLFAEAPEISPTPWLIEALARGQELGFGSEKSRSERLVTPLLLELSALNRHCFSIYSGVNLDIDEALGLKGECDFIFSFSRIQDFVTAPVFCITEAKKQDLEQGTIQCAAQLIGANKFNEIEGHKFPVLYGCSTTGIEWRFLQYSNLEIILDEERYLITNLPKLIGVLQTVVDLSKQEALSNV
jgi:hypothetical protein